MNRKLPEEAYRALKAIQDRAEAVSNNNFRGDNRDLKDAMHRIRLNQPWSTVIERSIASMKGPVDPCTLDESWLEDLLADDEDEITHTNHS